MKNAEWIKRCNENAAALRRARAERRARERAIVKQQRVNAAQKSPGR